MYIHPIKFTAAKTAESDHFQPSKQYYFLRALTKLKVTMTLGPDL